MSERRGMKALEMWCRRITTGYPGVSVDNMTTSWRDGLAFCALIHHFRPDLIDFSRLDKADVYGNNELAFRIAERHLGIPALLDAEDMAEYPVPDRLSIMTYLSQFYQAFASNGSSPVKRASETPENSLVISDVQSPPQKKPVLGIRKERCNVCNLPVYIAQRLLVNGQLYHRTCFKCSLCSTQLNPASCYEMDGEGYICESCPTDKNETKVDDTSAKVPEKVLEKLSDLSYTVESGPLPSNPNQSLVGIRKMMFESYIKDTDDAKLQQSPDAESPEKPPRTFQHVHHTEELLEIAHDESAPRERDTPGPPESPPDKHPLEKPPEKPPRSPKGVPPALLTNHSDGPQDTHRLGQLVECSNVVLVNNLDRFSDVDTKRSESGEGLHADSTNLTEMRNEEDIIEAVNSVMRNSTALDSDGPVDDFSKRTSSESYFENVLSTEIENTSVTKKSDESSESKIPKGDFAAAILPVELQVVEPSFLNQETEVKKNEELKYSNVEEPTESLRNIISSSQTPVPSPRRKQDDDYPTGLNPFGDDEENIANSSKKESLNPFGSSSDEEEPENSSKGLNPFGSDSEDDEPSKPVPKPRSSGMSTPEPLPRNSRLRLSNRSLVSLTSVSSARKKRPAPPPPVVIPIGPVPPSPAPSRASISSTMSRSRKSRRAPPPPSVPATPVNRSSELENNITDVESSQMANSTPVPDVHGQTKLISQAQTFAEFLSANQSSLVITDIDISNIEKEVCQKAKAVKRLDCPVPQVEVPNSETPNDGSGDPAGLPVTDQSLDETSATPDPSLYISSSSAEAASDLREMDMEMTPIKAENIQEVKEEPVRFKTSEPFVRFSKVNTSSRRLIPLPTKEERLRLDSSLSDDLPSPVKEKKDKDTANLLQKAGDVDSLRIKKKGRAPLPLTPKTSVKGMPVAQVRQELKDIEIKQQGLERQGIALEHKIRDKFNAEDSITPYVEELVLQLFELVNEKNELFRKQAELMYLRRQHHLEEEQADLEYQIRMLMSQPEANKTDSDKELEEKLINRLVEVVERRDAIIQCLEMDRLREAEEDKSIHSQLSQFSQAMGEEENREKISEKLKNKKSRLSSMSLLNLSRVEDPDRQKDKKKKWFTLKHTKNKR